LAIGATVQDGVMRSSNATLLFSDFQLSDSVPIDFNCFVAGTLITMASGEQTAIEKIKIGDYILSWNEKTKEIEKKIVKQTFEKQTEKLLEIKLANGKTIRATPEHRFSVNDKWVQLQELKINDELSILKTNKQSTEKVKIVSTREVAGETVYNFEVEDNHNYFAEGILVHNDCIRDSRGQLRFERDGYVLKDGEVRLDPETADGLVTLNGKIGIDGETYTVLEGKVYNQYDRQLSPEEIYQVVRGNGYDFIVAQSDQKQETVLLRTLSFSELDTLQQNHRGEPGNYDVLLAMNEKASPMQTQYVYSQMDLHKEAQFDKGHAQMIANAVLGAIGDGLAAGVGSSTGSGVRPGVTGGGTTGVLRTLENPESLRGASIKEIENLIPGGWPSRPMRTGNGTIYERPGSSGSDIIQISRGNPRSPDTLHQNAYVKISIGGRTVRIPLRAD
jgi:hypothetical protein